MLRDHDPNVIENFNGLWARGDNDTCPLDHSTECINVQFIDSGYKTRDGLRVAKATATSVLRKYPYPDSGPGDGWIELRSDNKLYHVYGGISFGVPAFTVFQISNAIAGMTDFGFVSIFGRAYISPSSNSILGGLNTEFVYVYDGTGVNMMRKAAGKGPTTAEGVLAAVNSATAGNVEAGIHIFGVVYETDSGFLTKIGPGTLAQVTADGTHSVDLSLIPVAASGTVVKRHIVASKLIDPTTFSGDLKSYQLYMVPNGTIANNVGTTITVNFYDSELIADASHLLDLLEEIPAVGGLGTYHGRMLAWDFGIGIGGVLDHIHEVMVSYAGEPEAMDAVTGILLVPREGTGITFCQEYRDILYVMKFNKIIAFNDNGDVPTAWPSVVIDQGLGCGKHGVAVVGLYGGTNLEAIIMINDQGIYIFTGTLGTPELSYKIKDFWAGIDILDVIYGISAYIDSLHQQLIVNIPSINTILVGDFTEGITSEKIKWTKWTFGAVPNTIMLFDKDNKLMIGMPTGVHWIQVGTTNDIISPSAAVKIPNPTVVTSLIPMTDDNIYHYGGVTLRASGAGNLRPTMIGLDGFPNQPLEIFALTGQPHRELFALANITSQRGQLQLQTTAIDEVMKINRVVLHTKQIYTSFPK